MKWIANDKSLCGRCGRAHFGLLRPYSAADAEMTPAPAVLLHQLTRVDSDSCRHLDGDNLLNSWRELIARI